MIVFARQQLDFSNTSRSSTRHSRVDLESHKRGLSVPVRTACAIVRVAQSIVNADPSVAHQVLSSIGTQLRVFCEENNVILSSEQVLPRDSFTYLSER